MVNLFVITIIYYIICNREQYGKARAIMLNCSIITNRFSIGISIHLALVIVRTNVVFAEVLQEMKE